MSIRSATPGGQRFHNSANNCVRTERKSDLLNRSITHRSLEATTSPSCRLLIFNNKERHARCKRGCAVYKRLQNVRLGLLLVNLRDGRFYNRHVARSFSSRRLRGRKFNTAFVGSAQVLGNGG